MEAIINKHLDRLCCLLWSAENNLHNYIIEYEYQGERNSCLIKLDKAKIRSDMLDKIELLIFNCLIKDYYGGCSSSAFCAKLFHDGDLVFRCIECCMDDTCSFCLNCFENSSHSSHAYRTFRSEGNGGYCDCGDKEAWTKDPTCSVHLAHRIDEKIDSKRKLKLRITVNIIINFIIHTYYKLKMYMEFSEAVDINDLHNINTEDGGFVVVVLNDESHTYQEVIESFKTVVGCSEVIAKAFAKNIDEYGIGIVYTNSDYSECYSIMQRLEDFYRDVTNKHPLKSSVIPYNFYLRLRFIKYLIHFIGKLCTYSDEIKLIVGYGLTEPVIIDYLTLRSDKDEFFFIEDNFKSFLQNVAPTPADFFFLQNVNLWKEIRLTVRLSLILKVLPLEDIKLKFAVIYSRDAEKMYLQEFRDDHLYDFSILNIFIQIFTAKSVAWYTLQETTLLQCLFSVLSELCLILNTKRIGREWNNFDHCIRICISHINGLLLHCPSKTEWNSKFRKTLHQGFNTLIECLLEEKGLAFDSNSSPYIASQHIYQSAATYGLLIEEVVYRMYRWIVTDKSLFVDCVRSAIKYFYKLQFPAHLSALEQDKLCITHYEENYFDDIEPNKIDANNIRIEYAKHIMQNHYTNTPSCHYLKLLLRFITLLLTRCHKFNLRVSEFILPSYLSYDEFAPVDFFKQSYNTLAIFSQDIARMLIIPHDRLYALFVALYSKISCSYLHLIMDKLSVQIALETTDPTTLFLNFRDVFFGNYKIFFNNYEQLVKRNLQKIENYNSLIYLFFVTIYQIITYRHNQFVYENNRSSNCNIMGIIDDVFIHYCAVCLSTINYYEERYSKTCERLAIDDRFSTVESVVDRLFNLRTSTLENIHRYILKKEFYPFVNKYSIYYNNNEIFDAGSFIEYQLKHGLLVNYMGGVDNLPIIEGELGEKFFSFLANSYARDMIIRSLQIHRISALDSSFIDIIIHICFLVAYDAKILKNTSKLDIYQILKSFFSDPNFTDDSNDCILGLLKNLNTSSLLLSSSLLLNNLMDLLKTDYKLFGMMDINLSHDDTHTDGVQSSNNVPAPEIDHKKLALERIKRMQENFMKKNSEAINYFSSINNESQNNKKLSLTTECPLVGYKKAFYLQKQLPNDTIDVITMNCLLCQEENHFPLELSCDDKLFKMSDYIMLGYWTDSNILADFNQFCNSIFDLEHDDRAEFMLDPLRHIECLFLAQSYGFNHKSVPIKLRSSGLFFGGCGHFVHKSCWDEHIRTLFGNELENHIQPDVEYDCTLCYSLSNATVPCVFSHLITLNTCENNNYECNWKEQFYQFQAYIKLIDHIDIDCQIDPQHTTNVENYSVQPYPNDDFEVNLKRLGWNNKLEEMKQNRIYFLIASLCYSLQAYELNTRADKLSLIKSEVFDNYRINALKYATKYMVYIFQNYGYNFYQNKLYITSIIDMLVHLQRVITNQQPILIYYIDYFKTMIATYIGMISLINMCKLTNISKDFSLLCDSISIEKFCLTLFYLLHAIQSIKLIFYQSSDLFHTTENASHINECIEKFVSKEVVDHFYIIYKKMNYLSCDISLKNVYYWKWIQLMTPFIRSSAIFFQLLNDHVTCPYKEKNNHWSCDCLEEFIGLIAYLDLPLDFTTFLDPFFDDSNSYSFLVNAWQSLPKFDFTGTNLRLPIFDMTKKILFDIFPVIDMPEKHLELISLSNNKKSEICKKKYKNKYDMGLCLICGDMMCLCADCNRDFVAMERHSSKCPGICSIILSVIENSVKFCYKSKVSRNFTYPYTNLKGQSVKKRFGSNLTYNKKFHLDLLKIWRYHTIHHTIYSRY